MKFIAKTLPSQKVEISEQMACRYWQIGHRNRINTCESKYGNTELFIRLKQKLNVK